MMNAKLVSDEGAMLSFGARLLRHCSTGGVITLSGDLGVGKTTLVRGALAGLGFQGNVRSPTYTLIEPYVFNHLTIAHFDLYRLSDAEELEYLGYREYLNSHTVCLVEWPEKASQYFSTADLSLSISHQAHGRKLVWKSCSPWGDERAAQLV